MDERGYRFGVGVLVLASLVVGVILVFFFGAFPNVFTEQYSVTINFPAAPGVSIDTPVLKSGVRIGRVTSVKLLPDDQGVNLELELEKKHDIRQREISRISAGSLITGDAIVEFVPPTRESLIARFDGALGGTRDGQLSLEEEAIAGQPLSQVNYIKGGQVAGDPMEVLLSMQNNMGTTFASIDKAGEQVALLAQDMRGLIGNNEGQFRDIARKTELTIDNFNQTIDAIEGIVSDPKLKQALQSALDRLPKLIEDADAVMVQTQATLESFERVGSAAERTLINIEEFTEPFGQQGEQVVANVLKTLDNLDALLADLRGFTNQITSSQGTITKLIQDDEMYYSVVRTLENVENLTRRLQPIVEDVRVFSDKIARDPRQLGVRGALEGRGVGLGVK